MIQTPNLPVIPISCAIFPSHGIPIAPNGVADPKIGVRVWAATGFSCGDKERSWHLILLEKWENREGGKGKKREKGGNLHKKELAAQLGRKGSDSKGQAGAAAAGNESQILQKLPDPLKKSDIP